MQSHTKKGMRNGRGDIKRERVTTEGQGEIETNHAWREVEEGVACVCMCVCVFGMGGSDYSLLR